MYCSPVGSRWGTLQRLTYSPSARRILDVSWSLEVPDAISIAYHSIARPLTIDMFLFDQDMGGPQSPGGSWSAPPVVFPSFSSKCSTANRECNFLSPSHTFSLLSSSPKPCSLLLLQLASLSGPSHRCGILSLSSFILRSTGFARQRFNPPAV